MIILLAYRSKRVKKIMIVMLAGLLMNITI